MKLRTCTILPLCLLAVGMLDAQTKKTFTPIQVESQPRSRAKNNGPWSLYETRLVANMDGFRPEADAARARMNRYGSDTSVRRKATGFFRAEQIDGRWWMIDPEGCRHLNMVVVGIRPGGGETNKKAFASTFGSTEKWIAETAGLLFENGYSGSGSWSHEDAIGQYNKSAERPMTHTPILNLMSGYGRKRGGTYQRPGNTGYPNQCIFAFDPEFAVYCDQQAQKLAKWKDDPTIVGYFSDNEMPVGRHCLEGYLTLEDPNDHGRKAAEQWLAAQGITPEQITDRHREEFAGVVVERYYSTVAEAIRRYDPNHMYLGSRLHGNYKFIRPVIEAAGRHCDVVSINYYGDWTPRESAMKNWGEWAGKPFIITEFYTKGEDAGLANTSGAGALVHTQQDRGFFYQHFCLGLLESRNCVGWHWFKYQDNDPTAKGVDPSNIDANKGMVGNDYKPYTDMLVLMRELNFDAYRIADYFDH